MTKVFSEAFFVTVAACIAAETLMLLLAYGYFKNLLESGFYTIVLIGPVSLWFGPSLYRYIVRASEP